MTLNEIAEKLVSHCRNGTEAEGLNTLYAEDCVSVEAAVMPGSDSREANGLDAIRGKHAWWDNAVEVHAFTADGPYPHGDDKFAVIFEADTTMKDTGQRMQMKEVGVYHVKEGKIVREEFFYPT